MTRNRNVAGGHECGPALAEGSEEEPEGAAARRERGSALEEGSAEEPEGAAARHQRGPPLAGGSEEEPERERKAKPAQRAKPIRSCRRRLAARMASSRPGTASSLSRCCGPAMASEPTTALWSRDHSGSASPATVAAASSRV